MHAVASARRGALRHTNCTALLWAATAQPLSETQGAVRRWFMLYQACEKQAYSCQLLGPDQICSSHLSLFYPFCPLDMVETPAIFLKKAFQSPCFDTKRPGSVTVLFLTMPTCGGGKQWEVLCNQLFICFKLNWNEKVHAEKQGTLCKCSAPVIDESPSVAPSPSQSPKTRGENCSSDTLTSLEWENSLNKCNINAVESTEG